jgi:hypothetical protein
MSNNNQTETKNYSIDDARKVKLMFGLLVWSTLILLGTFGLVVAGVVALFDAVGHGANIVNMSFAVLGAVIALKYIAGGVTYVLKKYGKVKA